MLAGSPFRYAMKMADVFYQEMEKNKDWIRPVTKYDEIEENRKNGKMSALLTLEEGEICEGDPALLRDFYRMGARMMTLTWNYPKSAWISGKSDWRRICRKSLFRRPDMDLQHVELSFWKRWRTWE